MNADKRVQLTSSTGLDIVLNAALDGVSLIEASAGTGKTWTITGLYLRFVVERGLLPEQLLVVSFTDAATAELRARIRTALLAAEQAFAQGVSDDRLLDALLNRIENHELARRNIRSALRGFDLAAIQTIHGFCSRVLAECAFESALPFASELLPDPASVLDEVLADFWRLEMGDADPLLTQLLLARRYSPSLLKARLSQALSQTAQIVDAPERGSSTELWPSLADCIESLRAAWLIEKEAVIDLLSNDPLLTHRRYTKPSVARWASKLDAVLTAEASFDIVYLEELYRFSWTQITQNLKGEKLPQMYGVFEYCDQLLELQTQINAVLADIDRRCVDYTRIEMTNRKRERRVHSYDDLLANTLSALQAEGGKRLGALLQGRCPVALVDEFQDTDPVQYEIFQRIYARGGSWFMVGDPKQAIYSFRGADVFAYLRGRVEAQHAYSLSENWRSIPPLVDALNGLYEPHKHAFLIDEIHYQRVQASAQEHETLSIRGDSGEPLVIWNLPVEGKAETKARASMRIANACAGEIARLLLEAQNGDAMLGDEPLSGGDIAVLVRTHEQGAVMRQALQNLGVAVVERGVQNVFDSREARELEILFYALAVPGHGARLRAALGTELLGWSLRDIAALENNERAWQHELERFARLHEAWMRSGPMTVFEQLNDECSITARLLALVDGERRLTNLRHVLELLQSYASEQSAGPERQLLWLQHRRRGLERDAESEQLRLESDERLVQIVTIHKAKGLEYPVVFCPFLWDGKKPRNTDEPFLWHDPERDHALVLELGSASRERARQSYAAEQAAESLRAAYVALTRAVHRCYLVWGRISQAELSPLAWLLFGREENAGSTDAFAARIKGFTEEGNELALSALARDSAGGIRLEPLPLVASALSLNTARVAGVPSAREFRGKVSAPWQMTSFTALSRRLSSVPLLVETPDHDAAVRQPEGQTETEDIFGFPRGANAGTCLHSILENIDFQNPASLGSVVPDTLSQYGIESRWADIVIAHIEQMLAVPMHVDGPALRDLPRSACLSEMEFTFPLRNVGASALRECLREAQVAVPEFTRLRGYLKGFIDLIFEHEQKFFVLDYKSNWLGPDIAHYAQAKMDAVMQGENYSLQYLIYVLALHRHLRARLPGYDYEKNFGGVYYLFLRGVSVQAEPGTGVWSARPDAGLISELDKVFDGYR